LRWKVKKREKKTGARLSSDINVSRRERENGEGAAKWGKRASAKSTSKHKTSHRNHKGTQRRGNRNYVE